MYVGGLVGHSVNKNVCLTFSYEHYVGVSMHPPMNLSVTPSSNCVHDLLLSTQYTVQCKQ